MAKVFISSTYTDLVDYRGKAISVCSHLGLEPVVMEHMNAMDANAVEGSLEKLSTADAYVGIYAYRYGTIPPGDEFSVTEQEYEYAKQNDIPRFCFPHDENYPWPPIWVDIPNAEKMKTFKAKIFSERILVPFKSVEDFGEKLTQTLSEWKEKFFEKKQIDRQNSLGSNPENSILTPDEVIYFTNKYLEALIEHCQYLPFSVVGKEKTSDLEITLDQIYIELRTTSQVNDDSEIVSDKRKNLKVKEDEPRYLTAREAVSNANRVVILGDPGSGKSTFIKKITGLSAHGRHKPEALPLFEDRYLPVLLNLRDMNDDLKAIAEQAGISSGKLEKELLDTFNNAVNKMLINLGVVEFYSDLLKSIKQEKCLMIFDGMDEVPQSLRKYARRLIETSVNRYRPAKTIVSCRIRSYFDDAVLDGYEAYTLAPFDKEQVKKFTVAWYRTKLDIPRDTQDDRAKDFYRSSQVERNTRQMASNPMMLTQMAVLHQRHTRLPDQRVQLYEEVTQLFLYDWQNYRGIQTPISDALQDLLNNSKRTRSCLEKLAFEAHRIGKGNEEPAELTRDRALSILQEKDYLDRYGLAEEFLEYIDQRCGILQGYGSRTNKPDTYAFPHRTFQEYLAGCYVNRQKKISKMKLLAELAQEGDFWDVVFQLSIEEKYHVKKDADLAEMAFNMADQANMETVQGQRLILWSVLLTELLGVREIVSYDEVGLGGSDFLKKVKDQTVLLFSGALTSLERAEAGNALAALGDPRFNENLYFLPDDDMLGFKEIPAGKFRMGSDPKFDQYAREYEQPQHQIDLPLYYLARFPVTVAQWKAYAQARKIKLNEAWRKYNLIENHPVVVVDWRESLAYCQWLDQALRDDPKTPEPLRNLLNSGWKISLPSEAEWEKAARGTQGLIYPYGNSFDPTKGNTAETHLGGTNPVGCFAAGHSPYGCEEMSGNVWEWTRSIWGEDWQKPEYGYPYDPTDGREELKSEGTRVLRGGSFGNNPQGARASYRNGYGSVNGRYNLGFRVCLHPSGLLKL